MNPEVAALSLFDLAHDFRRSSMVVVGISTFDQGNAVLLALSNSRAKLAQLNLLTPFAAREPRQLDDELGDQPIAVGSTGTAGFIGLRRRDGGVLFATAAASSTYQFTTVRDFRLPERIGKLQ
jgi:hypothetical protein